MLRSLIPYPIFTRYESWALRRAGVMSFEDAAMLRLEIRAWHGSGVCLPDGVVVRKGQLIGDLHIDNQKLAVNFADVPDQVMGIRFIRQVIEALQALAVYLQEHPEIQVEAICGTTLFWRSSERLGFTVRRIDDRRMRLRMSAWQTFLLAYFHPRGTARLQRRTRLLEAREVWMSVSTLQSLYGDRRSPSSRRRRNPGM